MIQKYRLKADARKFFDEKFHTHVRNLEEWNKEGFPIQLLDEVPNVYVSYGHEKVLDGGLKYSNLKGWNSNTGNPQAHFHFTVWMNDITSQEYGHVQVDKLMDKIQEVLNAHYK